MKTIGIILSVAQVLVSICIISATVLQPNKRSGLSGTITGGSETFYGQNKSRSLESIMSKATGIAMALLIVLTFLLNISIFA